MGLLSFLKRPPDAETPAPLASSAASTEPDAVAAARARARRRLLGATVLLGLGVIGFPLLFETQPRPIAVDIPIEIPRKEGAAPLVSPPAPPLARASAAVVDDGLGASRTGPGPAERAAAVPSEIVERAGEQGRDVAAAPARPAASRQAEPKPAVAAVAPASKAAAAPPPSPKPLPQANAKAAADDSARAKALLEGGQPAAPATAASKGDARVVVQVGAYTDAAKLAEARRKLEALGFKTYTQVVESDAGPRTRVRVGPFASRAEADKAAARVKSAGLPAAILTL